VINRPLRRIFASSFVLAILASIPAHTASAQVRGIGAGALVLDDYATHMLVVQTPQPGDQGYSSWISPYGGSLSIHLPIPPSNGAAMGFVGVGPATSGPAQVLVWNAPTSGGGTGGNQGYWQAASFTSLGGVTGSGTPNDLAKWGAGGTIGNSVISDNAGSITFGGYATGVLHSTAGVLTSSPVVLNSADVSNTLPATNGGTGNSTYAVGDILVANSTTTLARLPAGTAGQVLGISSSGGVTYVTNGATVTNTTLTQTVPATEDLGVSSAAGYIRLTNSTGATLNVTGVQVGTTFTNGSVITLVNVSALPADVIQITNLDGSSAPADQFDLPGGSAILLTQKGAATFIYDGTLAKWELVSTN